MAESDDEIGFEDIFKNMPKGSIIPRHLITVKRGRQEGTRKFFCGGFAYHQDSTNLNLLRCAARKSAKCSGQIKFQKDGSALVIQVHSGHAPKKNLEDTEDMKTYIKKLAIAQNRLSPQDIWTKAALKYRKVAEREVTEKQCRQIVFQTRTQSRPPLPKDFYGLSSLLEEYEGTKKTYKGTVTSLDGGVGHIFSSDNLLAHLRTAKNLHMDGTFKITPYHPRADQLFVIHSRIENMGIAAVYVLMTRRTTELYRNLFQQLKVLVPSLTTTVKFIVTDFERALLKALNIEFPAATRVGCEFHYLQATFRFWRKCHLSTAPKEALYKAWALPRVPSELWPSVFDLIIDDLDELPENFSDVTRFIIYLQRQWLPLARIVSVMNTPVRTNNLAEAFNRYTLKRLGGTHPNIWAFLELLNDDITMTEIKLKSLEYGIIVPDDVNKQSLEEQKRIRKIREKYHPLTSKNLAAYLCEITNSRHKQMLKESLSHIEQEDVGNQDLIDDIADINDLISFSADLDDGC